MKNALINITDALALLRVNPRFGTDYQFKDAYYACNDASGYRSGLLSVSDSDEFRNKLYKWGVFVHENYKEWDDPDSGSLGTFTVSLPEYAELDVVVPYVMHAIEHIFKKDCNINEKYFDCAHKPLLQKLVYTVGRDEWQAGGYYEGSDVVYDEDPHELATLPLNASMSAIAKAISDGEDELMREANRKTSTLVNKVLDLIRVIDHMTLTQFREYVEAYWKEIEKRDYADLLGVELDEE